MDLNWILQGKEQHGCLMLTLYATECVCMVTVKISINRLHLKAIIDVSFMLHVHTEVTRYLHTGHLWYTLIISFQILIYSGSRSQYRCFIVQFFNKVFVVYLLYLPNCWIYCKLRGSLYVLVIISSRHPFIQSACLHCAHQTVDYGDLIHIMIKDNYIDVCMQNCNTQTVNDNFSKETGFNNIELLIWIVNWLVMFVDYCHPGHSLQTYMFFVSTTRIPLCVNLTEDGCRKLKHVRVYLW